MNITVVPVTSLAFGVFGMGINTVHGKYSGVGTWLSQVTTADWNSLFKQKTTTYDYFVN